MAKKLFLLDAYALIYRSYFAFIRNPRFNSKGLNTSAMLGFANTLEDLLQREDPSHIAVGFDLHGPTFRHEMFKEYKANRDAMPEDLRIAVPYIRQLIEAYNIPIIEKQGYEADDVIGTAAKQASQQGFTTYMMTPDKDYAQLVDENTLMYKPKKGGADNEIHGISEVCETFAIERTEQVIDILGLMGDAADNIPGCPGIGPKTAMKLIGQFGSINGIYENINKLKGKQKQNLEENKDQVLLSRELVVINRDVPIDLDFELMQRQKPNIEKLSALYQEFEFRSLAQRYQGTAPQKSEPSDTLQFEQGTLFGGTMSEAPQADVIQTPSTKKNIENTEHRYILVDTPEKRASLKASLAVADAFAFDTETTSLDARSAELVCLSFAIEASTAYCVPIPADQVEAQKIVDEFKLVFADDRNIKVAQNIKYDMLVLANYGITIGGDIFDTMIAHYILQPDLRHNLDDMSDILLNYSKITTESIIGKKGKKQKSMRDISIEELCNYACEDADCTLQLYHILKGKMDESESNKLFYSIELPLVRVLCKMEYEGVTLNATQLDDYAVILRQQIIDLETEIHELAGEKFLVSSPKQLGIILFEKLVIDAKAKLTKTKQYSTSEEVLQKLASKHPIINKVLEYRGLKKLLNTYVEALPQLINAKTGKIHTSFNQTIAVTGRLSSTNPNLQNIPIRDENGKQLRAAFTSSDDEHVYLSADYSQIELRIMAAMSNDQGMIEAFANNEDIHTSTAAKIFKVSTDEVTSDMRRKAKTANFGIIYGISAFGLSQRLNIPRSEAKAIIDGYFEAFPRVKEFMDESVKNSRELGYAETLYKRRRYLGDINSANNVVRSIAERNAINTPIQGTAADIIKIAMIAIHKRMEDENLQSKMILQVHDELNFDVLLKELETVKQMVTEEMVQAANLSVPLTIEINHGQNWLEAH